MTKLGRSYQKTTLTTTLTLALLVGCGASNDTAASSEKKSKERVMVKEVENATQKLTIEKMNSKQQIEYSKQDLADRMSIELEEVNLSGATPVTWRSGALGCPEPGMAYTDALRPGVLIMLTIGNTAYRYHAKPAGQPFYCPAERAESMVVGESDK